MKQEDTKERTKKDKTETQKLKVHKDFGFLLNIKPVFINARTAKYLLQDGIDEPVQEYKEDPFEAYISFIKYDYQGKVIEKVASAKVTSDKTDILGEAVLTMRIKEKAWFNICDQAIHGSQRNVQEIDDGIITEDTQPFEEHEKTEVNQQERTGFHFEMFLERIEFRNSEKIEIKRKINKQNRDKARKLFGERKYYEASKAYKFIIHISENLPRNNPYSAQEKGELERINISARLNFIKCYFKIKEDWLLRDMAEFTKGAIDFLLKIKPHTNSTHYYHAKWLLKERFLDDALEAARKSNSIQRDIATDELIAEIIREKQNKGKIKVAVKQ